MAGSLSCTQPSLCRQQSNCSYFSACSWPPSSPASSCTSRCSSFTTCSSSGTNSAQLAGLREKPSGQSCGSLRTRNATAAERYRTKLKGRQCGLEMQMEVEERRNIELRKLLESKLSLYREFVNLLANNLQDQDEELALLGCRSIEQTLTGCIVTVDTDSDNDENSSRERGLAQLQHQQLRDSTDKNIERIDCELRQVLTKFRLVAGCCRHATKSHEHFEAKQPLEQQHLHHHQQSLLPSWGHDWGTSVSNYVAHCEPHRYLASTCTWPTPTIQHS